MRRNYWNRWWRNSWPWRNIFCNSRENDSQENPLKEILGGIQEREIPKASLEKSLKEVLEEPQKKFIKKSPKDFQKKSRNSQRVAGEIPWQVPWEIFEGASEEFPDGVPGQIPERIEFEKKFPEWFLEEFLQQLQEKNNRSSALAKHPRGFGSSVKFSRLIGTTLLCLWFWYRFAETDLDIL